MWSRALFVRYGKHCNAVWHRPTADLVATRHVRPGESIRLEPPRQNVEKSSQEPREPKSEFPERGQTLRRQYDVENESWVALSKTIVEASRR